VPYIVIPKRSERYLFAPQTIAATFTPVVDQWLERRSMLRPSTYNVQLIALSSQNPRSLRMAVWWKGDVAVEAPAFMRGKERFSAPRKM
jgi:hypothetical protein